MKEFLALSYWKYKRLQSCWGAVLQKSKETEQESEGDPSVTIGNMTGESFAPMFTLCVF